MSAEGRFSTIFLLILLVAGCAGKPNPEDFFLPLSLEQRQMQTRLFETGDEIRILTACAALLQDNGFQVDEADSRLGLLVSSKVKNTGFAIQSVGVVVVTRPVQGRADTMAVRVTFHEIRQGLFMARDPVIYQEFFARLGKALFLEAQQP